MRKKILQSVFRHTMLTFLQQKCGIFELEVYQLACNPNLLLETQDTRLLSHQNYSKRSSNLIFLNAPIIFIFTNSNTTVEFKFTNKCSAGKAWQTCYVYCDFSFWIMLTHRWFHKCLVTKESQLLVLLISSIYLFP